MTPQLYDNTVLISTMPGQRLVVLQGQRRRHRLGARRRHRQAEVEVQHDLRRRQAVGQPEGQQRRRPLVPARGRQPGARLHLRRQPGAALRHARSSPTARAAPAPTSTPNSLVALDGQTGKLLWYRQAVPHDLRDYDLMIPAILTTVADRGRPDRGRARRRQDGQGLRLPRRRRQAALDALRRQAPERHRAAAAQGRSTIFPGDLGGVETPMALADNRLFVPWLDFPAHGERDRARGRLRARLQRGPRRLHRHRRRHAARCSGSTSCRRWTSARPRSRTTSSSRAPTPARSTPSTRRPARRSGRRRRPPASTRSRPIDGDTLLVGAGRAGFIKNPQFELIAYSLP